MPANFTYPGVYISEKPSGARAIPAAATSIAMFVGMVDKGPFDTPTRVQSHADFARQFGETSSGEMALQVGQFFTNGGGDAYVMRIADGAEKSRIEIQDETGATEVLRVEARDVGLAGNAIRVEVDYKTGSPERTFNLTAYRGILNNDGTFDREDQEFIGNLSMDPASPRFVNNIVGLESSLVTATSLVAAPANPGGTSISGLLFRSVADEARNDILTIIGTTGSSFNISVNYRPPVTASIDTAGLVVGNLQDRIRNAIIDAYNGQLVNLAGLISVHLLEPTAGLGRVLEIRSSEGPVVISPASSDDCSAALMLGIPSGGIEIDHYSPNRPAPSGVYSRLGTATGGPSAPEAGWLGKVMGFAAQNREEVTRFELSDPGASALYAADFGLEGTAGDPIGHGNVDAAFTHLGSWSNVRNALNNLVTVMNPLISDRWVAEVQGLRLVLRSDEELGPVVGIDVELRTNNGVAAGPGYDLGGVSNMMDRAEADNIAAYTLGTSAAGGRQDNEFGGLDGNEPTLTQYQNAFSKIESDVQIFNMMVLPRAEGQDDIERKSIWGAASSFCAKQRAILFVDPEIGWTDIATAEAGADNIKLGVNTRHSVVYWPRLKIPTAETPSGVMADPSGSMAGLYARTDSRFGTWRAPAGIEATLAGVTGTSNPMSNAQQGRLNPKALNAIRIFPSGITSWGARMMVGADDTGNVDDKYINVRRMMLFIENSLYDGLRFAVFKNNAEPLWASIRLAAGSFMNGLMMQGAFASQTKSDAYYVLCDATTTTANDINLGIVNIIVGFAPNKPAEFVHLTVTQIAGQTEV